MADLAHANRGNVAVICWNTLNSKTWYVTSEKLDGEVSLGQEGTQTLLAINFADFTTTDGELKEVEDIEIAKANIDDRQLKLPKSVFASFGDEKTEGTKVFDFDKKPSKNKEEKSYVDGSTVFVYVPEEVCEDLDELRNKTITLILGEDNVAALILVQDDVAEKDFLTAYDAEKGKITVGGVKYDLADDYKSEKATTVDTYGYTVELNETDVTPKTYSKNNRPIEVALDLIDSTMDKEDIEKKIEVEITLNEDDEVKAIVLTTSAYIDGISDEVLVTKVKETKSKYTITTSKKNITWDIEDEEDEEVEFPKVYIDGKKADIRDIEAGMVLSIMGKDLNDETLQLDDSKDLADIKIYATSNSIVDGEAKRIKKANLAITLDGTVYTASNKDVTMSTEELSKYTDGSKEISTDLDAIVDNDTITLYLNMFGEYAFVTLDEVASDWTFGVVTYVSSNITWEGDDEEIAVRNIKVLLNDGTKKTYKLKVDTSDSEEISTNIQDLVVVNESTNQNKALVVGDAIAFQANADKVITIEDGKEIVIIAQPNTAGNETTKTMKYLTGSTTDVKIGDYVVVEVGGTTVDKDDEEFGANFKYEYTSKTTIFNAETKDVVSKWKAILDGDAFEDKKTLAIFEDDKTEEASYIIVTIKENAYGSEDAIYAIVEESENLGDKNYVKFVGQEEMEAKDIDLLDEGWLVAYRTASSKVSEVQKLINVKKIQKKDATDVKKVYDYLYAKVNTAAIDAVHGQVKVCEGTCVVASHNGHTNATGWKHAENCTDATAIITSGTCSSCTPVAIEWDGCTETKECPNASGKKATTCGCTGFVAYTPAVMEDIFFNLTSTTAPTETKFVNNIDANTTLEEIVLDEVEIKTSGKITLKFVETGDNDHAIDSVKLDKDIVKVYDLRNGEVKVVDIDDLAEEVNVDGEDVYVLAAVNGDYDGDGANVVFIVK